MRDQKINQIVKIYLAEKQLKRKKRRHKAAKQARRVAPQIRYAMPTMVATSSAQPDMSQFMTSLQKVTNQLGQKAAYDRQQNALNASANMTQPATLADFMRTKQSGDNAAAWRQRADDPPIGEAAPMPTNEPAAEPDGDTMDRLREEHEGLRAIINDGRRVQGNSSRIASSKAQTETRLKKSIEKLKTKKQDEGY